MTIKPSSDFVTVAWRSTNQCIIITRLFINRIYKYMKTVSLQIISFNYIHSDVFDSQDSKSNKKWSCNIDFYTTFYGKHVFHISKNMNQKKNNDTKCQIPV